MIDYKDELYHHGIKGMHWGVRRYQNSDGTLTDAGRKRYGIGYMVPEKKSRYRSLAEKRAIDLTLATDRAKAEKRYNNAKASADKQREKVLEQVNTASSGDKDLKDAIDSAAYAAISVVGESSPWSYKNGKEVSREEAYKDFTTNPAYADQYNAFKFYELYNRAIFGTGLSDRAVSMHVNELVDDYIKRPEVKEAIEKYSQYEHAANKAIYDMSNAHPINWNEYREASVASFLDRVEKRFRHRGY